MDKLERIKQSIEDTIKRNLRFLEMNNDKMSEHMSGMHQGFSQILEKIESLKQEHKNLKVPKVETVFTVTKFENHPFDISGPDIEYGTIGTSHDGLQCNHESESPRFVSIRAKLRNVSKLLEEIIELNTISSYPDFLYRPSDYQVFPRVGNDTYKLPAEWSTNVYTYKQLMDADFIECGRDELDELKKKHDDHRDFISWQSRTDGHGGRKGGSREEYETYKRRIKEWNETKDD